MCVIVDKYIKVENTKGCEWSEVPLIAIKLNSAAKAGSLTLNGSVV